MTVLTRGAFARPGTSLEFPTGDWRVQRPVHHHRRAPCHAVCPAGEDAQAYLALVEGERYREAWETLVAANPIPAITGRVCHHPCESACNRGEYDESIAIHAVERFLGDRSLEQGWAWPLDTPPADAPEVAVVGAGPAGLSAAYHLVRTGCRVILFEALPVAGGLLRTAIPAYRLPRTVLNAELERLAGIEGVTFEPGRRLGDDMSLSELAGSYAGVFLGPGTQRSREWSAAGATPRDLHIGIELLKEWMDVGEVPRWSSVAIIGAGNTAVDLARVLKRSGVGEVHIISHKAIPGPGVPADDAMPAILREIEQALEEGVQIHVHRGVQRLILRGEQVIGAEIVHMKKLPGSDGRLHRIAFEGTETILHVDQVIPAIGQVVEPSGLASLLGGSNYLRAGEWGEIEGHPGIFTGGDARGDHGTVSEAVGDGRLAAIAMRARIDRTRPAPVDRSSPVPFSRLNMNYFERAPRPREPVLPVAGRSGCEEIERGLGRAEVHGEGRRCFSCGDCLACDNCWTLCPDVAVLKTRDIAEDGSHYVFDYGYCKGCGICARECPCGYIDMVDER